MASPPPKRHPIFVALDNIRSLYNVGSIFRTSDAARVEKLFLCGYTSFPPRKEIDKTALGATFSVPWEYRQNPVDVIRELKSGNVTICVLEHTTRSVPYTSVKPSDFPICLVLGNELVGVSKEVIERADMAIEIPMYGSKHSLNVAVAYGIAVFECVKVFRRASEGQRPVQS
ncbi:MAG TPA: RNA methyltransferase [Bacteroidota bacterium]